MQKDILKSKDFSSLNKEPKQDSSFSHDEKSNQQKLSPQEKLKMFSGFSKLNLQQRYKILTKMQALSSSDVRYLKTGGLKKTDLASQLIENVIGYFQMPLGVATNFIIDGKLIPIPMAVEETSIIAAASKTARWIREHGFIKTFSNRKHCIGQIQIHRVRNFENLKKVLKDHESDLIEQVHKNVIPFMVQRGGGVRGFKLRKINQKNHSMAVIHILVNTCDAMGANAINQICEYLKTPIERLTGEQISLCILSNLSDECLARAQVVLKNLDQNLIYKIQDASIFAEEDPYRAATSNKGVMNGMDAVLMATGNDFRAVEAGVHSYACRNGKYQSITRWRVCNNELHGELEVPLMLGIVGGMTRIHPTSKICMKMMEVESAEDLARICAAVGLVQNLGAIRALTTVGIIEGHMKLHIKNLAYDAGAVGWEFPIIQKHLESLLQFRKRISLNHAEEALNLIRKGIKKVKKVKKLTKQEFAITLLEELRQKYMINKP